MAASMSKVLKESDVKSRLAVPRGWWKLMKPLLGRHEAQMWAVDWVSGMFWEFRCAVRQKGPYEKPVFQSEGWLKFVNYKGLRAGDQIFLEATDHEFRGTRFVLRATRLDVDGKRWLDI